jgi:hypothetical protein
VHLLFREGILAASDLRLIYMTDPRGALLASITHRHKCTWSRWSFWILQNVCVAASPGCAGKGVDHFPGRPKLVHCMTGAKGYYTESCIDSSATNLASVTQSIALLKAVKNTDGPDVTAFLRCTHDRQRKSLSGVHQRNAMRCHVMRIAHLTAPS